MTAILYLIPIALGLGFIALACFIWTVRDGQYDDMEGDPYRILDDESLPLKKEKVQKQKHLE